MRFGSTLGDDKELNPDTINMGSEGKNWQETAINKRNIKDQTIDNLVMLQMSHFEAGW